jgi:RimJ/RimL family protein N-acetyltransferase
LYELKQNEFNQVRSLFSRLDYNLVIESIFNGLTPAKIFVDSRTKPKTALVHTRHKIFLGGSSDAVPSSDLNQLILERLIPSIKGEEDAIVVQADIPDWGDHVEAILAGLFPVERQRMYLECDHLLQGWQGLLPAGYTLRGVDKQLVGQDHLENIEYLREELCSERPSMADFLEKSFGFCILAGDVLASWCLSEYNTGERCEVGVATVDEHQQRGLATTATLALVDHALSNGYRRIGWHCWTGNVPSVALARRAGFVKVKDYSIYLCVLDLKVQFALKGDDFRSAGDHAKALEWYQKAVALDSPPSWVYYLTARSQAQLGDKDAAFASLRQAMAAGFNEMDRLRAEADFAPLHRDQEWEALFNSPD